MKEQTITCANPILVGGCGSSGTTLMQKLLNSHSKIACGPEMSVFDRPMTYKISKSQFYARWQSKAFNEFELDCVFPIRANGNSSYFAFHRDEYHSEKMTEALIDAADDVRDFWSTYFSGYAFKKGKPLWAEKTPNNVYCVRQFFEWFPAGRFINVLRDGRDVVASLVQTRGFHPVNAIYRWLSAVNAYQEHEADERVFCIRYENLVEHPAATLFHVFTWLGLEPEPWILNEHDVHSKSMGRWETLEDINKRQIDLTLTDKLFEYGYVR